MRLDGALDDLFATGSHVRVLRALAQLPEGLTVSGRDIARRAGVSQPTARQVLMSLDQQGLLVVGRRPHASFYRLNTEHVLAPLIRDMFTREAAVRDELEAEVASQIAKLPGVSTAYLFGSAGRGDMRADSDIDVAVTGDRDVLDELPQLDAIHRRFGNRVNVVRLRTRGAAALRKAVQRDGRALLPARRRKAR